MTHAHTPAISSPATSRRSLLAGLATICAAAPAMAAAGTVNEDAELSALHEEFVRMAAASDAANEHEADTEGAYFGMQPDFPQAAIKTEADREMCLSVNVGQRYSELDLPRLRKPQRGAELRTPFPGRPGEVIVRRPIWPEKTARAQEIVKALEDYRAADEAARLMSGYGEAEKWAEEADKALKDIEARILAVPAKTLAGVIMKARVVEWCYLSELPDLEEYSVSKSTAEAFAMAVTVDLVRITKEQANG